MEEWDNKNIHFIHAKKIYEILDLIEKRPLIFLTSKSISALQDFLNGYLTLQRDDLYNYNEPDFDEFKYWILQKNDQLGGIQHPFSRVLLADCNGDEVKAFEKFYFYLNEFKSLNK